MLDMSHVSAIRVTLASPEQIRSWSSGEVSNPKTLNYKTGKPEPGGLFCERIFGPTQDWSCACGKYQQSRAPGFTCDECGVEVAPSSVRRTRMGHIELAAPVAHPWFTHDLACLLDLSSRTLGAMLSHNASIVTAIDEDKRRARRGAELDTCAELQALTVGTVLKGAALDALSRLHGDVFQVGQGAEAVRVCLASLDLDALARELRQTIRDHGLWQKKAVKRLHIVEALRASRVDPASMILSVLPVLPPALRPLVELQNGHLATNDLNALYERVICRNERIKRLLALEAPGVILNNEQRLLQDACGALFDNAHRTPPVLGSHGKPLKSLTDAISGKAGRFRKNLLGKRVDYSARSVIVGDPELKLYQCGLPTKICLELFKPFLIRRLLDRRFASSAHAAKRMVERTRRLDPVIWDVLEEVMDEKAVLLNRAPTLHRLSIQAFEAVRVEGSAITLHPLVCSAYNADFDGDQMAVHLPLSDEAQAEAWELLLSTHNLRAPATGEPSISLGQDIALGLFYLTAERPSRRLAGRSFTDAAEATLALEHGVIDLHTRIFVRLDDPRVYDAPAPHPARTLKARSRVETTLGRLLFNEALPEALRFRNYTLTKERARQLVADCLRTCGPDVTADLADRLKTLGFHYATRSGTSFALSDIERLPEKRTILEQAEAGAREIEELHHAGMITDEERDRQLIDVWTNTADRISERLEARLQVRNPHGALATIINSGATKARFQQIRQLSGIRGLMAGPGGRIMPLPVRGNYLEGLKVWEEFHAASGARDALEARALHTSTTGHLTRKLVEVGQAVWVMQEDCGTTQALAITNAESQSLLGLPDMRSRIAGRVLAEGAGDVPAGTLLDEALADYLIACGISAVRVRSPLGCQARNGICRTCYGRDLGTGQPVRMGLAVGVIAGQSIGEPGTQLSMRVFHTGGIAGAQGDIRVGLPRLIDLLEARVPKDRAAISTIDGVVEIEHDESNGTRTVRIVSRRIFFDDYPLPPGSRLLVKQQERVQRDQALALLPPAQGDMPVLARTAGRVLVTGDAPLTICSQERETRSHTIAAHRALAVEQGQWIETGTPLVSGTIDPQELLLAVGCEATARYLVGEVQQVFRSTGVHIDEKHIEVIVRQMVRYVLVVDPGDSAASPGELLDRFEVEALSARALAEGGNPARAQPVLLGLTKCALETHSWIAAASFQDTSRVLAAAAIRGKTDTLQGLKERIIIGRRIPMSREKEQERASYVL